MPIVTSFFHSWKPFFKLFWKTRGNVYFTFIALDSVYLLKFWNILNFRWPHLRVVWSEINSGLKRLKFKMANWPLTIWTQFQFDLIPNNFTNCHRKWGGFLDIYSRYKLLMPGLKRCYCSTRSTTESHATSLRARQKVLDHMKRFSGLYVYCVI